MRRRIPSGRKEGDRNKDMGPWLQPIVFSRWMEVDVCGDESLSCAALKRGAARETPTECEQVHGPLINTKWSRGSPCKKWSASKVPKVDIQTNRINMVPYT
jgi:hypothetical protein